MIKQLTIAAMTAALVACGSGGGASGPATPESAAKMSPIQLAEGVVSDMREATSVLEGIQTAEEAEAALPRIRELGESYSARITAMRTMDQSKIGDPQKYMEAQMASADAMAGFMAALDALRGRSSEAGNIVTPELQAFRPA
ncbi:MAG: hypothetical protein WBG08_05895 [Litorimonas sp.]